MSASADRAAAPSERYWEKPFTVMATIHGPAGWFDVVDGKAGKTVAVCPKRCFARRIADALSAEVRVDLGPGACSCTAPFDAPDVYAAGECKAHGVAWHRQRGAS